MIIVDEAKLNIPVDPHNRDYQYLIYTIFLNKGYDFLKKIIDVLKDNIKNWEELKISDQNYLIRKVFVLEIRWRRFLSKYVELIEKLLVASTNIVFYYYKFLENNDSIFFDDQNLLLVKAKFENDIEFNVAPKQENVAFAQLDFQNKLKFLNIVKTSESKRKKFKEHIFSYLLHLGSINKELKEANNLFKNFQKIKTLRNAIYHYRFVFGKEEKKILAGLKSLSNVLSKSYQERFCYEIDKSVKNIAGSKEISQVLFKIMDKQLKIFHFEENFLQEDFKDDLNTKLSEEEKYYIDGCFDEVENFKKYDKEMFQYIINICQTIKKE